MPKSEIPRPSRLDSTTSEGGGGGVPGKRLPAAYTTPPATTTTEATPPEVHTTAPSAAAVERAINMVVEHELAYVNGNITKDALDKLSRPFKQIISQAPKDTGDETGGTNKECMPGQSPILEKYHNFDLDEVQLIRQVRHHSSSFRLVNIVGYTGDSAKKYFDACCRYDESRGAAMEKEDVPLLCTVGVAGQGKTELCYEILRNLTQRQGETTAVCGVMVTFSHGHEWKVCSDYQAWDHRGIISGLWARIGEMMNIGNWQSFNPATITNIFDMLHLITKKRNPDAAATEVHLLVDETLKITDDEQRRKLLDEIGSEVHRSITKGDTQRSYALVTSLSGVPISNDMAASVSHRKVQYLPLSPPTPARGKIALALLIRVMLDLWKMQGVVADTSAFASIFAESFAETPSSPNLANQKGFMSAMRKHTNLQLSVPVESLNRHYLSVKAAVFYAIYSAGTWRSFECFFKEAAEPSFLNGILADPAKVPRVGRSYWGDEVATVEDELKPSLLHSCTQQLMKLCAAWDDVVAGGFPEEVTASEATVANELNHKVMWVYQRDDSECIPFVNLRFLHMVRTDERLLSPVEKLFRDTYRVLVSNLMVRDIGQLPSAFESAVVLSLALRLLALNRTSTATEVSATLGALLPGAQFKNDDTKLLQLHRSVSDDAFSLSPLRNRQRSGTATAVEIIKECDESVFAFTEEKSANAEAIEGAVSLRTPDGKPVVGAYSMKFQQRGNHHAQDAFATVSAFMEKQKDAQGGRPIVAIVAAPEAEEECIEFASTTCDCVFIGRNALGTLLGPFGASYLRTVMEEKAEC